MITAVRKENHEKSSITPSCCIRKTHAAVFIHFLQFTAEVI